MGQNPVSVLESSIDNQELAAALVARLTKAKKLSKNYESLQIQKGLEDFIKNENLDRNSVYNIFGLFMSVEAVEAVEKFLQ